MFRPKMLSHHQLQLQKYKRAFPSCFAISCHAYSGPGTDKTSFTEMILQRLHFALRFDDGNYRSVKKIMTYQVDRVITKNMFVCEQSQIWRLWKILKLRVYLASIMLSKILLVFIMQRKFPIITYTNTFLSREQKCAKFGITRYTLLGEKHAQTCIIMTTQPSKPKNH